MLVSSLLDRWEVGEETGVYGATVESEVSVEVFQEAGLLLTNQSDTSLIRVRPRVSIGN